MDKIEDDILDAVHQRNLRSPETTFRAQDGQFYRPLLSRQIIYGSGTRKFSVMFVRTLSRKFIGDETTSALLIGLILASRFRFTFIENQQTLLFVTLGDNITDAEFELACRQLIYDVERMEQESSEFGMNSPDLLQQAFGPEHYEIVRAFYRIWFPAKNELFNALTKGVDDPRQASRGHIRQQVKKFADDITPYNRRFIEMSLKKYTASLEAWLKDRHDVAGRNNPSSGTVPISNKSIATSAIKTNRLRGKQRNAAHETRNEHGRARAISKSASPRGQKK
jgi:hypothetical protein